MNEDDLDKTYNAIVSSIYEFLKQLQDYYKTLITVNTACVLVMVAFLEKVFSNPLIKLAVPAAFVCFALSLATSLLMMTFISEFSDHLIEVQSFRLDILSAKLKDVDRLAAKIKKLNIEGERISKKQKLAYPIGNYSFFLGITILIVFVTVNILCK